jgi:hypothetical protein
VAPGCRPVVSGESANRFGCRIVAFLRPPPGRLILGPFSGRPVRNSDRPRLMVLRATPVARDTAVTPHAQGQGPHWPRTDAAPARRGTRMPRNSAFRCHPGKHIDRITRRVRVGPGKITILSLRFAASSASFVSRRALRRLIRDIRPGETQVVVRFDRRPSKRGSQKLQLNAAAMSRVSLKRTSTDVLRMMRIVQPHLPESPRIIVDSQSSKRRQSANCLLIDACLQTVVS